MAAVLVMRGPAPRAVRRAIVLLLAAGLIGASCRSSDDVAREQAGFGATTPGPLSTAELPPRYRDDVGTLQREDTAEEAKLALVQELAVDNSDAATRVLLVGTGNASILVSMASIKALSGRGCGSIAAPLQQLLDDQEWQRRAWAAKVLGDTRCREALRKLTDRLQHERDGRVQQRLEAAITALNEEVKG
jgi:hypothetical protein